MTKEISELDREYERSAADKRRQQQEHLASSFPERPEDAGIASGAILKGTDVTTSAGEADEGISATAAVGDGARGRSGRHKANGKNSLSELASG